MVINPLCRLHSVRPTPSVHPICHKLEPKIARTSFNLLRVNACATRWKSSIQHLPTLNSHSYKTPVAAPTVHSASQTFEKVITPSVKPAAAPTSVQKLKVYGSPFDDPHALMTIDHRYPDWLKK